MTFVAMHGMFWVLRFVPASFYRELCFCFWVAEIFRLGVGQGCCGFRFGVERF